MKTPASRFWIDILVLGTSTACGVALLMATLGAAGGVTPNYEPGQAADPSETRQAYDGMITDTKCGAKHQPSIAKAAGDCARACVHGGAQFALVDGDRSYVLEGDLGVLKKSAGQRARIVGSLSGNTITVSSVTAGE